MPAAAILLLLRRFLDPGVMAIRAHGRPNVPSAGVGRSALRAHFGTRAVGGLFLGRTVLRRGYAPASIRSNPNVIKGLGKGVGKADLKTMRRPRVRWDVEDGCAIAPALVLVLTLSRIFSSRAWTSLPYLRLHS